MLPEIGHKFGPYEILGKLGGGGMGVVFRAWDDRLHREVAIKLLHDEFQAPGMRQRFLLEARAASALNHPHICTIFDMGEQDGEPFLVMEVLEGITLKERIAQGACSSEEIVRFGLEIADALSAAHGKGIVHRDVKPANIFLQGKPGSDRQVKVLDFGLAKVSMTLRSGRDSRALELTSAGSTVGTLAYMSPEQARGEHLDTRSDLFSLGIVLYEMATRRTPFRGATTALAFQALLTALPDPIRAWNVTMPRELERIIMRLLTKDRANRYQTAREVEEALRKLATRGDGDWLRKLPRPEVPLVPSLDPVARGLRKSKHKSGPEPEEIELSAELEQDTSSTAEDRDVIRPRRMPTPENRPRDISVSKKLILAASSDEAEREVVSAETRAEPSSIPGSSASTEISPEVRQLSRSSSASAFKGADLSVLKDIPGSLTEAEELDISSVLLERSGSAYVPMASSAFAASPSPGISATPVTGAEEKTALSDANPKVSPSSPGSRKRMSASSADVSAAGDSTGKPQLRKSTAKLRTWLLSSAVLASILGSLGVYLTRSGNLGQIVISPTDTILLAPVVNRTGNENLDNVISQGVEIELSESSQLHWLGLSALIAGRTQVGIADHVSPEMVSPRSAAQRLGARAYLFGELSRKETGYAIRLDVIDVASNDRLGSVSETASSLEEMPSAIVRLSLALRTKLGEAVQAGKFQAATPLALQTIPKMAALNLFAQAQAAFDTGEFERAADLYQRTLVQAPDFTLAELQLAEIYAREGAELAASSSASHALAYSSHTGDRVASLAQISAALLSDQDPVRAIVLARQLLTRRPHDELALLAMARAMRSQGHMTEALLTAQQAYKLYPFSEEAYSEAAYALIGLDRFEDSLALGRKASSLGLHCECGNDVARYLDGQAALAFSATNLQASFNRALALDDSGQLSAAVVAWRAGVNEAKSHAETVSAAGGMLAQAAVDRAFTNHCAEAFPFIQEAKLLTFGRLAAFHLALAEGLCSPAMQRSALELNEDSGKAAPFSQTVPGTLLPLLTAAQALSVGEPMQALAALSKVETERDQLPTVAYLRGLAHQLGGQDRLALIDFDQAAGRRGYAFLAHSTVAPLAIRKLGDLLAASGSVGAAAAANQRFQKLWIHADSSFAIDARRAKAVSRKNPSH